MDPVADDWFFAKASESRERDAMNSVRRNFAVAARLAAIFFAVVLVAPHGWAQQEEHEHASADAGAPPAAGAKASRDQRAGDRQRQGTRPQGNEPHTGNSNQGAPHRGSANAAARPDSVAGDAGDRASSENGAGRRGTPANIPGRARPESADGSLPAGAPNGAPSRGPRAEQNGPRRGPAPNGGGRPGSSEDAANDRGPWNNPQGQTGPRQNGAGQTRPALSGPGRTRPGQARQERPEQTGPRGNPANAPGQAGPATDAENSNGQKPAADAPARPGRRGWPNNANKPGGQPANADNNNTAPANDRPNGTKGGFTRTTRANGTVIERDKNGRTTSVTTPRGSTARVDRSGRVTTIRDKSGNEISRGPRGERRVVSVRADRSRVVTIGRRGGYVERPFDRGGRQYVGRTYVIGGHSFVRVYRGHYYHGVPYYVYVPPYYYAPAYYRWLYRPWPRPIYYSWGWYGSPWYRPYAYYFGPYPAYPYASLWLTDYVIAENLRLAYEADGLASNQPDDKAGIVLAGYRLGDQVAGNQPTGNQAQGGQPKSGSAVLMPEVKQMIAEEVQAVIADQERAAASSSNSSNLSGKSSGSETPPALDPNHRVFVVYSVLDVSADGETCSLTSSDVIKRTENTPGRDNAVEVQVVASKKADCAIGSRARVQFTDLNDMHNHLVEQVDAGMKILAEKQGKDGLPAAPPANPRAVPEGTAAPDPTATADLQKQEQQADQAEKEVQQEGELDFGSGN